MADPVLLLENTEATSEEFTGLGIPMWIQIGSHAGGVWTLQAQDPDGNWEDLDGQTFDGGGLWLIALTPPGVPMRITGGTVGAKAWVYSNG